MPTSQQRMSMSEADPCDTEIEFGMQALPCF
jgi:hypothetical protein